MVLQGEVPEDANTLNGMFLLAIEFEGADKEI